MPAYSVAYRRGPCHHEATAQRPTDGTAEVPVARRRLAHPDAIGCFPWPGNFGPLA
jgi:hypothetical protein